MGIAKVLVEAVSFGASRARPQPNDGATALDGPGFGSVHEQTPNALFSRGLVDDQSADRDKGARLDEFPDGRVQPADETMFDVGDQEQVIGAGKKVREPRCDRGAVNVIPKLRRQASDLAGIGGLCRAN